MLLVTILSVGVTKESWLKGAIEEYVKRLQPVATLKFVTVKDDEQLLKALEKVPSPICLDPLGKVMDSEEFSSFVVRSLVEQGSRLTFVIGGPDGLPKELRSGKLLLSLSKLTFTHQITRLILVEQLYRAFEINRGSPYHRA